MSCDVANSSPFGAESLLEDSWHKAGGDGELDSIAEFNAEYGTDDGNDTINPQLAFGNGNGNNSNNSSQQNGQYNSAFNGAINGLDQTLSPEASAYGAFPTEFGGQSTGSPYFPSVESNPPTFHQPPHMRNNQFNHRRSVSEPPTGPPPQMQHGQQATPAVMFHRDNHFLGKPLGGAKPVALKSQYNKTRPQRQYTQTRKQKHISEPYPRPDMRQAQTQPLRHMAPTSAPVHHMPPQYYQHPHLPPQHQHQHQQHMMMMMQEPQYVSSRVCTPTPEATRVSTPQQVIDPALSAPPTPAVGNMSTPLQMSSPSSMVSIPMTVEELRSMIFEAVQKAVRKEEEKKDVVGEDSGALVDEVLNIESHEKEQPQEQPQDHDQDQDQVVEQDETALLSLDFEPSVGDFETSAEDFEAAGAQDFEAASAGEFESAI